MKTLNDLWREYRDQLYPGGEMPADQNKQLHMAFFAGAIVMIEEVKSAVLLPYPEAMRRLVDLEREVTEICRAHADSAKGRN